MIHIAIISPEFLPVPAVKDGGVETLITDFLDVNEDERKARIDVYSLFDTQAKKESAKYKYTSFNFYKFEKPVFNNFFLRVIRKIFKQTFLFNKNYFKKIVKDIKKENYDYVIVENKTPLLPYLSKSLKKKSTKILIHIHNSDQVKPNKLVDLSKHCFSVLAVSNYVKNLVLDSYPNIKESNIKVIYDFSDINYKNTVFDKKNELAFKNNNGISENERIILYCGRIIESKGIKQLLKSLITINNPNVNLLIIGNSWYGDSHNITEFEKELKELTKKIPGKVIFTGYVNHADVGLYYSMSDICVFPSIAPETAGLVQLEAMGYKKMTIVSNSGGMPEYIGKSGFVVNLGDQFQMDLMKILKRTLSMDNEELRRRGMDLFIHSQKFNGVNSFNELIDFLIKKQTMENHIG